MHHLVVVPLMESFVTQQEIHHYEGSPNSFLPFTRRGVTSCVDIIGHGFHRETRRVFCNIRQSSNFTGGGFLR